MIKVFILSSLLSLLQTDKVDFTLVNSSDETVHLKIGGFDNIMIGADNESKFHVTVGEVIIAFVEHTDTPEENELELFTVEKAHNGQIIDVSKAIRDAKKAAD